MLDLVRGWREQNLEAVVAEVAEHLRRYRVGSVVGDRYSAEWVVRVGNCPGRPDPTAAASSRGRPAIVTTWRWFASFSRPDADDPSHSYAPRSFAT